MHVGSQVSAGQMRYRFQRKRQLRSHRLPHRSRIWQ
ncbi:hypothetical protein PENARI_c083G07178 [Penicillium arizonense]|uniref:Uncharacterized protein n=1 Tax=Penicillium arizonense TaxID=1835702 RepID=A0A1F5L1M6_PENAI|nr:hypothetical protein PENARI_c083G07178 [Penicillium arizonense]OGE46956.1 hypothetical protein PENARI_c083G07178 [Penicillium arizonense]